MNTPLLPLFGPSTATARRALAVGAVIGALAGGALAQTQNSGGIYTCIDSKGRRITSDRPIPECLDREQRELGKTGVVRRVVPPSYTAEERARLDAQRKAEEAQQARVAEERRRDRALLVRYPNQAAHDKERAEALSQIDEVLGAVNKRQQALQAQRKEIDTELEFYQNDPKKAPSWLQRKIEDNTQQAEVQKRFLADQAQEKQRINARFDEELAKLKMLWTYGIRP
jgi:DNA repair exonuclease SbcCD ATPase subunit